MFIAQLIVNVAMVYAVIGVGFAIAFVIAGVGKIDPSAAQAGIGFRLLILPGVAALWPLLLLRWVRGVAHPPLEINAHRRAAREVTQ
jgi:hypothetical protein